MKKHVKITTLEWFLDLIYPCYCKRCRKIGEVLCDCCIFYNRTKNKPFFSDFDKDFHRIMACGMRKGVLSELISQYKFLARRHYRKVLVEYLDLTVQELGGGEKYVLVPLPTIQRHIRERGFDHVGDLCEEWARKRGFSVVRALKRRKNSVQVGSSAKKRGLQAKQAYESDSKAILEKESHFLLVDDVWTTGATMRAAREVLAARLRDLGLDEAKIKISAICLAKNDGYEF